MPFIILWIISPIVLLILYISERRNRIDLQKQNQILLEQIAKLTSHNNSENIPAYNPLHDINQPNAPPPTPAINQDGYARTTYPSQQGNFSRTVYTKIPENTTPINPAAPKNNINSMNVMLILGALLIVIAGFVFGATTWNILSGTVKVLILVLFSGVFAGGSFLADRKLSLHKTGLVFYAIASIFLPVSIITAGYMQVFGAFLSTSGDGKFLLWSLAFIILSAGMCGGCLYYKNRSFAWISLLSFSAFICCFINQFTDSTEVFSLLVSVYSLAIILLSKFITGRQISRFEIIFSQFPYFSVVNTAFLSIFTVISSINGENDTLNLIACAVFAGAYLLSDFKDKSGYGNAVPFTVFSAIGLFSVISPESTSGVTYTLTAVSLIVLIFSLVGIIPESVRKAMSVISGIMCIVPAVIWLMFIPDFPCWQDFAMYAVITAEAFLTGILHKNKPMLSAGSVLLTASTFIFADLVTPDSLYAMAIVCGIITMFQALFVFCGRLHLRTSLSDMTFALALIICNVNMALYNSAGFIGANIILVSSAGIFLPVLKSNSPVKKTLLSFSTLLNLYFLTAPISEIIPEYIAVLIAVIIVCVVCAVFGILRKSADIDRGFLIAGCIVPFLGISTLSDENCGWIAMFILAAMLIIRSLILGRKSEYCGGFFALLISSATLAEEVFEIYPMIFAAGLCSLIYTANLLYDGENFKFSNLTEKLSRISLSVCSMIWYVYIGVSGYIGISGDFSVADAIISAVYAVLTCIAFYNVRKTIYLSAYIAVYIFAISEKLDFYISSNLFFKDSAFIMALFVSAVLLLTIPLSFVLHRDRVFDGDKNFLYADPFALSRFIFIIYYLNFADTDYLEWFGIILLAVCVLSLLRKSHTFHLNSMIISTSGAFAALAVMAQPFIEIPDVISLEFKIIPVLIYCFTLRFIWKDNIRTVHDINFAAYLISYLILIIAALASNQITDALIIVVSSFTMIIFAFIKRRKKLFLLGTAVTVFSVIMMSMSFWESLAWWVYLLAAGIIFIGTGAINELRRQSSKPSVKEKISMFLSDFDD